MAQLRKVQDPALCRDAASGVLEQAVPDIVNWKVPRRRPNAAYRGREYLLEKEVADLIAAAAREGRHGARDAALILIAYRHGLRVSELVSLRWDQVDLTQALVHVVRRKHGMPAVHPLRGPELRALRRLRREGPDSAYVFVSERQAPLTPDAVRKIVTRAGQQAGLAFPVHPHMLRHATGYKLANDGHDTRAIQHYLGHRNIQHTTRYTELASDRFRDFWQA
ncbi:tyrosine-type recombinase/integrase [Paraburkholderia sp. BR14263]|uniref:tyrosine-type recombinase/integrase n=1 Tax=unclassified Paraburkholderia TaxID=2615204 RepID=UPI0034CEBB7F